MKEENGLIIGVLVILFLFLIFMPTYYLIGKMTDARFMIKKLSSLINGMIEIIGTLVVFLLIIGPHLVMKIEREEM